MRTPLPSWLKRISRARPQEPTTVVHTALIVDDETPIRTLVDRILREAGWQTFVAEDGEDALMVAASIDKVDLLLTDLMMPRMNGNELARRLRALRPDLPVLYLTGFSDKLFADQLQLWENEAFLDKPCSVRGLLEAVSLVIHGPVPGAFGVQTVDNRVGVL